MYILFTKLFFLKDNCVIKCLHDCLSPLYWQACVLTSLSMSRLIMVLASSENQHFHCWNPDGKKKKKNYSLFTFILKIRDVKQPWDSRQNYLLKLSEFQFLLHQKPKWKYLWTSWSIIPFFFVAKQVKLLFCSASCQYLCSLQC